LASSSISCLWIGAHKAIFILILGIAIRGKGHVILSTRSRHRRTVFSNLLYCCCRDVIFAGAEPMHCAHSVDQALVVLTGQMAVDDKSMNLHFPVCLRPDSNGSRFSGTTYHVYSSANIVLLLGQIRAFSSQAEQIEVAKIPPRLMIQKRVELLPRARRAEFLQTSKKSRIGAK
jgi:hypothetical protein